MSKLERLEKQIQQLSPEDLAEFRRWFAEFDAQLWDLQFVADADAERLDALADKAHRAHAEGLSTEL
jgi:succinate dehydrogenase flavin-adding protein (antitoxin of CptAB toxin-antitoxin module)